MVLISNCHCSEKPNIGPSTIQRKTEPLAKSKAELLPASLVTLLARRSATDDLMVLSFVFIKVIVQIYKGRGVDQVGIRHVYRKYSQMLEGSR